jgi:APA family basic amino acid/polyamine antiporter
MGAMIQQLSLTTAVAIVIANMIGTGVFTSLGYQAAGVPSAFALMALWVLGGLVALCGALSYGELASLFPRSGGEYNFLSRVYHPAVGFCAGWIAATVGFAAPAAAASMAMARYAASVFHFAPGGETALALGVVALLTFLHAFDVRWGGAFQRYYTALELLLIAVFAGAGLFFAPRHQEISFVPRASDIDIILGPAFFIALAYVSFSYSGWNAAAYVAGEIKNPRRNVPRALFLGALAVTAAYVLLNFVFLYTTPAAELRGKLEIGHVSAGHIFGHAGGAVMGGMIALLLVSTVSSMIFAGPRVTQAMGEDFPLLGKLAVKTRRGAPANAVLFQSAITVTLILTATFESVVKYIAFTLDIFACLTVAGVFIMRWRQPHSERVYRAWGYPLTPLIFLAPTVWTLIILLRHNTAGSVLALGTIVTGLLVYGLDRALARRKSGGN